MIFLDFYGKVGDPQTDKLLHEVRKKCQYVFLKFPSIFLSTPSNTLILDEKEVPWFPRYQIALWIGILNSTSLSLLKRHINDLDKIANRVLDAGEHTQRHTSINPRIF
jgi:hypothetical protein